VEPEAALGFYGALFGWTKISAVDMGGGMGVYVIYGRGQRQLGGMFKKTADMPAPTMWTLYARVHDVKSKAEELEALGGTVANGPMEVPGGDWIVQFMDPQGALFALHAPARKP
jgi:predicted enzyme related to lactoylglutathione lyase